MNVTRNVTHTEYIVDQYLPYTEYIVDQYLPFDFDKDTFDFDKDAAYH